MRKLQLAILVAVLGVASSATAAPILVSQNPWGQDTDTTIMNNVFGAGNWTFYNSYAAATPASVFSAANAFVFLEGGDGSDGAWQTYVNANAAAILNWVNAGGALLIQSAGWSNFTTTLGPGTLTDAATENSCGTLTAAGAAAFTTTANNQCGNYLAHDVVSGAGLTSFMTGNTNGLSIVAGTAYGAGYIMYSGLTNVQFHNNGASLLNDVVGYTAQQTAVPEPASMLLLGSGLLGLAARVRRKR